ncbi:MAG: hypothetical protein QM765_53750 [Myxococcales bacterium]
MSVAYQTDAAPVHVADTIAGRTEKRALELYLQGTYVLNPVYNAYLNGLKAGVYRLRELAPDCYFSSDYYRQFQVQQFEYEEIGYRTYGWPAGMEELVIAVELPEGKLAEISLHRPVNLGGFSDADCLLLSGMEPLIGAIYRRIWQNCKNLGKPRTNRNSLDIFLRDFGKGTLSARECEVAHMILKGHSSRVDQPSSANLGHDRENAPQDLYAKLGLSTQQELFSLFLASLHAASDEKKP